MLIYLIRHAEAVDLQPDHARPLSERGREQVATLAKFLRRSGAFSPEELWHSPLVRARETAEMLAREMKLNGTCCCEIAGLRPEDEPDDVARQLAACARSVAVVGHEPHLSGLASLLVSGAATPPAFVMKKGATLALERAGTSWRVRWHVAPGLLR